MGKHRERNNVLRYSQAKDNNDLFKAQGFSDEDLLGETRAITFLEKTQLMRPVVEEKEEVVLPKLKKQAGGSKKIVLATLILLFVVLISVFSFFTFRKKFKDVVIEVGTKDVSASNFVVSKMYSKKASLVTDLSKIDFDKVGEYEVTLKYGNKEQVVMMKLEDTTPPEVEFQDVYEYTGYEINPNDFIKEINDYSEYSVDYKTYGTVNTEKYEDYKVKIIVKDTYGNETSKDCILSLGWLKKNVTIEAGEKNVKSNMVVNVAQDARKIPDSAIKEIDVTRAGEYEVKVVYDGEEYTSRVRVVDDEEPNLVLKNVSIYETEKVSKNSFIKSVSDNSGKVTTKLLTEITYKVGQQMVKIEARDLTGNVVVKEAVLTIKEDKKPPVFSGLKAISIKKNSTYDYRKGVKAVDNIDGEVDFTYNDSSVKYGVAGTYYVTYTASDTKGNKVTSKRTVEVMHDANDTKELLNKYADSLGNNVADLVNSVRKYIKYNTSWGGDDPVWYGLKERRGNCYVHAKVLQGVLTRKGITNKLIWTKDKSHYWNLVYVDGHWRHVDSTPGNPYVLLTDEEMASKPPVYKGDGWNTDEWPAAN